MKSPDDVPGPRMDEFDFAILDGIRALFEQVDPAPADLAERVRFAVALGGLEAELARLVTEEETGLVGARGTERSRTVSFDSASLTIMIRIDAGQDGAVRVDGWLAPPQCRQIELQTKTETLAAASDDQGRFAFARVPPGAARLLVRAAGQDGRDGRDGPGQGGSGSSVVTPALVL